MYLYIYIFFFLKIHAKDFLRYWNYNSEHNIEYFFLLELIFKFRRQTVSE